MKKRNVLLLIIFLFTAKLFFACEAECPAQIISSTQIENTVYLQKQAKVIKQHLKIFKAKTKVKFKAGEVRFSLNKHFVQNKPVFGLLKHVGIGELFFLCKDFYYLLQLRGPPPLY